MCSGDQPTSRRRSSLAEGDGLAAESLATPDSVTGAFVDLAAADCRRNGEILDV